ncbi:hypothetical protein LBW89_20860 [Paenibacillus sp. alder61]|uniref:Uncharacterized protein n=1 Tax=Paenibacillus faecis TaxID=862114 RepID=A0A5D0CXK0_9BACL|nr:MULTISPECIES: hypothetical protein [Paenibacillus]MCA1295463.1 hypothetical protein [Paenibacillus sp. alder61]TYA14468.1 hypothetical protein FRY98_01920 [Paenibacillus faecis]
MGLDAFVNCNCLREGKVKPAPFDLSLLEWTDDGIEMPDTVEDEIFYQFHEWKEQACTHEDMQIYSDRVGNTSGMNVYYGVLERLGEERFPLLRRIWGSPFTAEESRKALSELEQFERRVGEVEGIFLLESGSMEEYQMTLVGEDRWFYSAGNEITYRLNPEGFCVQDREGRVLFQSRAFTQETVETNRSGWQRFNARFSDSDTGSTCETTSPISKKIWGVEELYYPASFQVVNRGLTSSDLRAIRVLRKLFEASIQTGNPVIWV